MAKKKKSKKLPGVKYADMTDPKRIEEQKYLSRWKGAKSAPSLFEKIDKDSVYEATLKNRTPLDDLGHALGEPTMGTSWGIGKPKPPN